MPTSSQVHPTAINGFSREASTYARARPDYPPILASWLRDQLGLKPGGSAVDLGAGTGKFTRLLLECGAKVTAIEPVEAMRLQLQQRFAGLTILNGTAQSMPLSSGSNDVVCCAQAFHWFGSREVLDEIHRVLVPGGMLGLIWNVRDASIPWVAALTQIVESYARDTPRFCDLAWRGAFTDEVFSTPLEEVFPYEHIGPPETVIVERFFRCSCRRRISRAPCLARARCPARRRVMRR